MPWRADVAVERWGVAVGVAVARRWRPVHLLLRGSAKGSSLRSLLLVALLLLRLLLL